MEKWDIYNSERIKTDKIICRGSSMDKGDYHIVVHACLFNIDGAMLIQQRQSFKDGYPGMWDVTVGGSAISGENSQQAIERELLEELGIKLNFTDFRPQFTINFDEGFDDYFLRNIETIDLDTIKLQYDEVQNVKWATKSEIINMMDTGEFIPYYKAFIELLFDLNCQFGCIRL